MYREIYEHRVPEHDKYVCSMYMQAHGSKLEKLSSLFKWKNKTKKSPFCHEQYLDIKT